MLTRIAERMADSLARNSIIDESEKELYVYAVYTLVSQVFPLILVMITGALMGKSWKESCLSFHFCVYENFPEGFMQSICIHVFSVHVLFVQYAYILRELSGTES